MDLMNVLNYFANNSGLCGVQIGVKCPDDQLTPEADEEGDDSEKEPWFLWKGALIGFSLGFVFSVLMAFLGGYFVLPPPPKPKYHSVKYRL